VLWAHKIVAFGGRNSNRDDLQAAVAQEVVGDCGDEGGVGLDAWMIAASLNSLEPLLLPPRGVWYVLTVKHENHGRSK
jgi:hypothetical protein